MKALLNALAIFLLLGFAACEEDSLDGGINPPQLEARGVQADRFSFAINVKEDGLTGRIYFLVLASDEAPMTAEEIRASQMATSFDMNGANFKTASMPGLRSQTNYTLYAVITVDEQLSRVASLEVTTL